VPLVLFASAQVLCLSYLVHSAVLDQLLMLLMILTAAIQKRIQKEGLLVLQQVTE
jgi:hypothetical protein